MKRIEDSKKEIVLGLLFSMSSISLDVSKSTLAKVVPAIREAINNYPQDDVLDLYHALDVVQCALEMDNMIDFIVEVKTAKRIIDGQD